MILIGWLGHKTSTQSIIEMSGHYKTSIKLTNKQINKKQSSNSSSLNSTKSVFFFFFFLFQLDLFVQTLVAYCKLYENLSVLVQVCLGCRKKC